MQGTENVCMSYDLWCVHWSLQNQVDWSEDTSGAWCQQVRFSDKLVFKMTQSQYDTRPVKEL